MKSNGQIIMSHGGGDENQFLVTFQDLAHGINSFDSIKDT